MTGTPEATQTPTQEQPPAVDEHGRPYKDTASELGRKYEDAQKMIADLEAENEQLKTKPSAEPAKDGESHMGFKSKEDLIRHYEGRFAENPVETILELINMGVPVHLQHARKEIATGSRILAETKAHLKKTYPDFVKYEDEFNSAVSGISPGKATRESLEWVFQGIRGRHVDDLIKDALGQKGEQSEEKQEQLRGPTTSTTSAGTPSGPTSLTPEQQKDLLDSGLSGPEAYLRILKQRQETARKLGYEVLPQTLSENYHKQRRP